MTWGKRKQRKNPSGPPRVRQFYEPSNVAPDKATADRLRCFGWYVGRSICKSDPSHGRVKTWPRGECRGCKVERDRERYRQRTGYYHRYRLVRGRREKIDATPLREHLEPAAGFQPEAIADSVKHAVLEFVNGLPRTARIHDQQLIRDGVLAVRRMLVGGTIRSPKGAVPALRLPLDLGGKAVTAEVAWVPRAVAEERERLGRMADRFSVPGDPHNWLAFLREHGADLRRAFGDDYERVLAAGWAAVRGEVA